MPGPISQLKCLCGCKIAAREASSGVTLIGVRQILGSRSSASIIARNSILCKHLHVGLIVPAEKVAIDFPRRAEALLTEGLKVPQYVRSEPLRQAFAFKILPVLASRWSAEKSREGDQSSKAT
jgi:hypothetical protein